MQQYLIFIPHSSILLNSNTKTIQKEIIAHKSENCLYPQYPPANVNLHSLNFLHSYIHSTGALITSIFIHLFEHKKCIMYKNRRIFFTYKSKYLVRGSDVGRLNCIQSSRFFFHLWYDVKKYKSTSVHIDYIMVTL